MWWDGGKYPWMFSKSLRPLSELFCFDDPEQGEFKGKLIIKMFFLLHIAKISFFFRAKCARGRAWGMNVENT